MRARETVSQAVAEYLVALGSALPPEPNDPEAAFTGAHGPGLFAYTRRAYPRRYRQRYRQTVPPLSDRAAVTSTMSCKSSLAGPRTSHA